MYKLKPKDTVAVIIVFGMVVLKLFHQSSALDAAVGIMIGYYYGRRVDGIDSGH